MNRRSKTFAIIGGIALVATIAICCICITDWSGMSAKAFLFMLWAEIAFFGAGIAVELISSKGEEMITRSSWYVVIVGYSALVFAVSLLNLSNHNLNSKWFWVAQIVLLTITLILLFVISSVSKSVRIASAKAEANLNIFNKTLSRMKLIADKIHDEEQSALLTKLAEEFYFTDANAVVNADTKLEKAISTIELEIEKSSPDKEIIYSGIAKINSAINERKIQLTSAKRGRI